MRDDFLIVGAGITGSVFAREMTDKGYSCRVVEKRDHIGGQCFCEKVGGVNVHKYGAHIFHTDDNRLWRYFVKYAGNVRQLGIYTVQAMSGGVIYPLPFNMNTFAKIWSDVRTPKEAMERVREQAQMAGGGDNLRDEAIRQVGEDVFELLIKGYTEKQWGRRCEDLPKEIIGRIPVRFTYDNNYYYCNKIGIPRKGYNGFFDRLLDGVDVWTGYDITEHLHDLDDFRLVLCTCPIDEFFDYCFGRLEYRSLDFKYEVTGNDDTQGCAVVNYCDNSVPYTRRIEHNFFTDREYDKIVVSYEYPIDFKGDAEPYYPILNERNTRLYQKYVQLCKEKYGGRVIFSGRLGGYKYISMDEAIGMALKLADAFEDKKIQSVINVTMKVG